MLCAGWVQESSQSSNSFLNREVVSNALVAGILRKELDNLKSGASADQVWSSCLDLLKAFDSTMQDKDTENTSGPSSLEVLLDRR